MAARPDFGIDTSEKGRLRPTGELDGATSPALTQAFERAATDHEGGELHLDLRGLSFIDSAGMRAIILIERSARERGLKLVVAPPPEPLTELFQITGLAGRLTLTAAPDEPSPQDPFLERVEMELPSNRDAPSAARAEIRQAAQALLGERDVDTAILLASELVTNAVIHPASRAASGVGLTITRFEDRIRCEVSDSGRGFDPSGVRPRAPESGGRGLLLVNALASRWGLHAGPEGRFYVWFELDAAGGQARALAPPGP